MNAVQFTGVIRAWLVVKREKHALFLTLWNQARHKKFAKIVVQLILYQILIHITHLSFTSTKLILYCTLLHVNFAPQFAVTRRKHKKKTLRFKFALKLSIRIIIIARQRIGCGEPSETSANFYMNQISNLIMEAFIYDELSTRPCTCFFRFLWDKLRKLSNAFTENLSVQFRFDIKSIL